MSSDSDVQLHELLNCLPIISGLHARTTEIYLVLDKVAKSIVHSSQLAENRDGAVELRCFGQLVFPYQKMGAVSTLDLFGLDELIIFAFYWANRNRYKKVADIGANLGLHSILMNRCGWTVEAYEPDPIHADLLERNLKLNNVVGVTIHEMAVSDEVGTMEFVRVVGNTTGSHLARAKANPYGVLERFPVKVASIDTIMSSSDLIKMDVEGQESIIILATNIGHWKNTDMMVEVGSAENAQAIFEHLKTLGVNAFSQKLGWQRVVSLEGMPMSYKEGSLFVSMKSSMPWAT